MTTLVTPDTIIGTAAVVTAVLILAGACWAVVKFIHRVVHFLDDWQGEEARPGQDRRPGMMERLAIVEERTEQLQRNGGSSVADAIERIERIVRDSARAEGG